MLEKSTNSNAVHKHALQRCPRTWRSQPARSLPSRDLLMVGAFRRTFPRSRVLERENRRSCLPCHPLHFLFVASLPLTRRSAIPGGEAMPLLPFHMCFLALHNHTNHTASPTYIPTGKISESQACEPPLTSFLIKPASSLVPQPQPASSASSSSHPSPPHTPHIIGAGATYDNNDDNVQCRQYTHRCEKEELLHSKGSRQR